MWCLLLAKAVAEPIGEPIGELEVRYASPDDLDDRGAAFAEGIDGDWILVQGRAEALDALEAEFETRSRREDHRRTARDGEPTLDSLEAELRALGAVAIGESVEGRDILALQRGAGPRVRILGGHHGDETAGVALAMELARSLEVPGRSLWIVPIVNPDGYAAGSRQNANEVDLNRNYDQAWADSVFSGPEPFSEPETLSIRTLASFHPPVMGLSLHSGALNIGYPWNHTRDPAPEEDELILLGAVYAAACVVEDFSLVNGADWYVTYGDSNDWSLARHGAWEYTVELSVEKSPADPTSVVEAHLAAVEAFVTAELGSEGIVLDAETGRPVSARLSAEGTSPFWSSPIDGTWAHRYAGPFTVEAVGYEPGTSDDGWLAATARLSIDTLLVSVLEEDSSLALDATEVVLTRPGHDDVLLDQRDGSWRIDPSELAVGAWDVLADTGVKKRGVLVTDARLPVRIDDAELADDLVLGGAFAAGTRAFALYGDDRALAEIDVLDETATELRLGLSSLPADGTVDILVVSKGVEVGIADVFGELVFDTHREAVDTGDRAAAVEAEPRTGCSVPATHSSLLAIAIGALLARRRTTCSCS
ncbi:MAG TPA: M14 family zinc carboxypeptidase [Myxococcota bacterium]|nr:M14 family zinc carboxypeptidase [Myxococcota bacterium]